MTEQTLDEFLLEAGQPEGFTDTADTTFTINNDDDALWAMRRLAHAQREIDRIKAQAQIEIDRINLWVEGNTTSLAGTVSYFDRILGDYLMRVREDEADGRKSLSFPDGVVSSRTVAPKVEVTDLEAFIAWAEANGHGDWVRVKREANLSEIKRGVDYGVGAVLDPITGQQIEGLAPVEGGISTTIKVAD